MIIRPIDALSEAEVLAVATGMRQTLIEVLGAERGGSMYTMDWLVARVRWHLDPATCTGAVFVAAASAEIVGHTIVRLDKGFDGEPIGLFSTTYVRAEHRGSGLARQLVSTGEGWMRGQAMTMAVTYTDPDNTPLLRLFASCGYRQTEIRGEFAVLVKSLA